jgi:hypothetical protein
VLCGKEFPAAGQQRKSDWLSIAPSDALVLAWDSRTTGTAEDIQVDSLARVPYDIQVGEAGSVVYRLLLVLDRCHWQSTV